MVLTSDKQRIKTLLTETVMLLCKNGLHFKSEFCIEGLIGITLDQDEVFLVSIKETVRTESNEAKEKTIVSTSRLSTGASASSADERARSSAAVKIAKAKVEVPEATFPDSDTCEFAPEVEEREGPRRSVPGTARKRRISSNQGRLSDSAIGGNSSAASARQFDNSVTLDMDVRPGETAASVRKSKTVNDSSESEPIQKRLRTPSSARSEDFSGADDSRSRTTEPSRLTPEQDYIEIKEESLSDNEFDSSVNSQGSFVAGAGGYGSSSFGHGNAGAYGEVNPGCSTWAPGQAAGDVYGGDQQQQQQQQQSVRVQCLPATVDGIAEGQYIGLGTNGSDRKPSPCFPNNLRSYKHKCLICDRSFQNYRDLRGHMAYHHGMQKEFMCPICGKEYGYKRTLVTHLSAVHHAR